MEKTSKIKNKKDIEKEILKPAPNGKSKLDKELEELEVESTKGGELNR